MQKIIYFSIFVSLVFLTIQNNPENVISDLNNKVKKDSDYYDSFINNLIATLKDTYAFYEISKNPPQPSFSSNYHTKVDIEAELKNIDTTNIKPYDFIQKVSTVLSNLKDSHVLINWDELKLNEYTIILPISYYYIKKDDNGDLKIYGICNDDIEDEFGENDDLIEYCNNAEDEPISSINNMDPFDFTKLSP